MPTKNKTTEIETEIETTEIETEIETTEIETEKMVKIRLPRERGESDTMCWSINGRRWLIKRGVEVEVPEILAEFIYEQEEAKEAAYNRIEAAKNASNQ